VGGAQVYQYSRTDQRLCRLLEELPLGQWMKQEKLTNNKLKKNISLLTGRNHFNKITDSRERRWSRHD
jgi:hypothetical protein